MLSLCAVHCTTVCDRGGPRSNVVGDWRRTDEGTWTHAVAPRELPVRSGPGEVAVVPGTVYLTGSLGWMARPRRCG